ncbi:MULTISPECIES: mechanosensitive ion channel domain-containing protein [Agarivorans]|uniref:Small-conductance mechanosensitive channel n=1 Tax=Agarivorans albus MKT 106 TaxID=1331007 RepID=R9PLG6_AGAAL|nr:mechanosensitive ion channel domain-containing protein [Agarivorans albus]GAD02207.1 small-conductance mechanosensitive channel [Agarivorans albus MKT 106]
MSINTFLLIVVAFAIFYVAQSKVNTLVLNYGAARNIAKTRIHYVSWVLRSALVLILALVVSLISDLGFNDFGVFLSSVFAVIGVALFAQWSILSNVTASIIVFFFFPYRVGNQVKILDGDNSVEGRLEEITLFHVILLAENGSKLTFPNAMVFQKAVVIGEHQPTRAVDSKPKAQGYEEEVSGE